MFHRLVGCHEVFSAVLVQCQDSRQSRLHSRGFGLADVLFFAIMVLFAYTIYRTCVSNSNLSGDGDDGRRPGDDHGRGGGGYPPGRYYRSEASPPLTRLPEPKR